jgi:hypothetical protein
MYVTTWHALEGETMESRGVEIPLTPLEGEELDRAMILALHSCGDQRTPAGETQYRELIAKYGPGSDPDVTIDDYAAQLGRLAQLESGDDLSLADPDLAGERLDIFVPQTNSWVVAECHGDGFSVQGLPEENEDETEDEMIEWVDDAFRAMYRRPAQAFKDNDLVAGLSGGSGDGVATATYLRARCNTGRPQGSVRRTRRVANKSPGRRTSAGDGDPEPERLVTPRRSGA